MPDLFNLAMPSCKGLYSSFLTKSGLLYRLSARTFGSNCGRVLNFLDAADDATVAKTLSINFRNGKLKSGLVSSTSDSNLLLKALSTNSPAFIALLKSPSSTGRNSNSKSA